MGYQSIKTAKYGEGRECLVAQQSLAFNDQSAPSEWETNHEHSSGVTAAEQEQVDAGCKQGIGQAKPVWAKFQMSGRIDRI
jgi:hypothetical protein